MRSPRGLLQTAWPALSLALIILVLVALLGLGSPKIVTYLIQGLVMLVFVVGLYIFVGNSGVLSLGHAVYLGIGAYVGGILSIPLNQREILLPGLPDFAQHTVLGLWAAAATAAIVTGVIGYVLSIPLSRVGGLAAAVSSLAVLQIFQVLLTNSTVVSSDGGTTAGVPVDVTNWTAFGAVLIALAVAFLYQRSSWGARLRATREDAVAATSLGINIARERRRAFAISAAMAGLAGAFSAHSLGTLVPGDYYLTTSFLALAMLVVGGINSLAGAVVGTIAVTAITDVILSLQNGQSIGPISVNLPSGVSTALVALLLIIVLIWRPAGLTGSREIRFPRRFAAGPADIVPVAPREFAGADVPR
jgi:branched-chain amino acid transport system permease protein